MHTRQHIDKIAKECNQCNICVKHCSFLQKYGNPGKIATSHDFEDPKALSIAFECSLCTLCEAVCPAGLNPSELFLENRREIVCRNGFDFKKTRSLLNYEKRGLSKRYTYYALPEKCDTVFFPGCTLAGTRPETTFQLYKYLSNHCPTMGVVMDCCCRPSHDLGLQGRFEKNFGEMKQYLEQHGIKKILVACPGCYKVIKSCGFLIRVETVYEIMSQIGLPALHNISGSVCIHDPCAVRQDEKIHRAVRHMVISTGLELSEMAHSGKNTLCCGEGGAVNLTAPELAKKWTCLLAKESRGEKIITYCAGCFSMMKKNISVCHLLDLVFDPMAALTNRVKVYGAPLTYLNRIFLKRRFKRTVVAAISRER